MSIFSELKGWMVESGLLQEKEKRISVKKNTLRIFSFAIMDSGFLFLMLNRVLIRWKSESKK